MTQVLIDREVLEEFAQLDIVWPKKLHNKLRAALEAKPQLPAVACPEPWWVGENFATCRFCNMSLVEGRCRRDCWHIDFQDGDRPCPCWEPAHTVIEFYKTESTPALKARIAELEAINSGNEMVLSGNAEFIGSLEAQLTAEREARQKAEKDVEGLRGILAHLYSEADEQGYVRLPSAVAVIAQGKENKNG
jgi:hypothetical protein